MRLDKLFENYENVDRVECKRTGAIPPDWLKGTLLRNGPGKFKYGDTEVKHWFDGLAYMQRYSFKDGKMFYMAKCLESDSYKACEKANRWCIPSFGTTKFPDPCQTLFGKLQSYFEKEVELDNCLVNFVQLADSVYALTETVTVVKVDPETLAMLGKEDISDHLSIVSATAHPQGDYEGNVYNAGHNFGKEYVFTKTNGSKGSFEETTLLAKVPYDDRWNAGYHHSFGMSDNYAVLFETPVRISVKKLLMRKVISYSFHDSLYWKDETNTNVIVVDKKTGMKHTIQFTAPPFFTFHHANTYEADGFIVADFCHMKNPGKFDDLLMEHMRDGTFGTRNPDFIPHLYRMVIPTTIPDGAKDGDDLNKSSSHHRGSTAILQTDGSVFCTPVKLCDFTFEFPRYNWDKYNMRPYRYVYGSTLLFPEETNKLVGIVKADVETGKVQYWTRDHERQLCAEPVFLGDPEGIDEDDGVLLVPVMTVKDEDLPIFLILDAKDLSEICRYSIPTDRLPPSFHSLFVQ